MPASQPTHPFAASVVLKQAPASTSARDPNLPDLPLRLKATFHLRLPDVTPASARDRHLSAVVKHLDIFPSSADGGVVQLRLDVKVRGQEVQDVRWMLKRARETFNLNREPLGLSEVSAVLEDGRSIHLQTTSSPPLVRSPGAKPIAAFAAVDVRLSWGSPPTVKTAVAKLVDDEGGGMEVDGRDQVQSSAQGREGHVAHDDEAARTRQYIDLASGPEQPPAAEAMCRTLDACFDRFIRGQLVKCLPLVFNGPHISLTASDRPYLASIAGSMRQIIHDMGGDRVRKTQAKALYEDLTAGLAALGKAHRTRLKDALGDSTSPSSSLDLSSFDLPSDSDDDAEGSEQGTVEHFERVLVGGLDRVWERVMPPRLLPALVVPELPTERPNDLAASGASGASDAQAPLASFGSLGALDAFDDIMLDEADDERPDPAAGLRTAGPAGAGEQPDRGVSGQVHAEEDEDGWLLEWDF